MQPKVSKIIVLFLGIMLMFFGNSLQRVLAANNSAPTIEPTDCSSFKDANLSGPNWRCGYLSVPENRQNSQSRTIKVAYAVSKASGTNPQPDPLVKLEGGPGLGGIGGGWDDWSNSPLGNRDLILVDPRGVGYSLPGMKCPRNFLPDASAQKKAPNAPETMALGLQWAQSCRDSLVSQGFDLTAYNSLADANDLEDLRQALGYPAWNLYGISYGTRTALVTMRAFPNGIRSVVLDSVIPPQIDKIGGDLTTTVSSLSALFSRCKADSACDRDYPDLETKFHETIRKLDQDPIQITIPVGETGQTKQVWATGYIFAGGVKESMKANWLVQIMPIVINQANSGDKSILERLLPGAAPAVNYADYYTVFCHDMSGLYDQGAYTANLDKHLDLKSFYAAYSDAPICAIWGAGQADPAESQPVQSDIPTLLLNGGDYDSASPPSYANLAASTLSHSFTYIFQEFSHVVSFEPCSQSMMADFLNNPSNAPDSSCMAQMKGLPFVTDVYINQGAFNIFMRVQDPYSPLSLAIGLIGLVFLTAIIGLPIIYFRSRGQATASLALAKSASLTLWVVSTLNLSFMVGAWLLSKKALAENYGWATLVGFSPYSSRTLFLLPWLTSLLVVVLLVFSILAWKNHWWKRLELILFSLGTLAALSLTGILIYLKVLSV